MLSRVAPGVSICDLCQYGDDLINAHVSSCIAKHDSVKANSSLDALLDKRDIQV